MSDARLSLLERTVTDLLERVQQLEAGKRPRKKAVADDKPLPNQMSIVDGEVEQVFAHYRTFHPRTFRNPSRTSKEWKLIERRLGEGFTVDDLKLAIDGNHASPWHNGENETGRKYQSLELIVRDGSKVQQFMEAAGQAGRPRLLDKTQRTATAAKNVIDRMFGHGEMDEARGAGGESTADGALVHIQSRTG